MNLIWGMSIDKAKIKLYILKLLEIDHEKRSAPPTSYIYWANATQFAYWILHYEIIFVPQFLCVPI